MSMKKREYRNKKHPGVKPGDEYWFQWFKWFHGTLFGYKMLRIKLAEIRHEVIGNWILKTANNLVSLFITFFDIYKEKK